AAQRRRSRPRTRSRPRPVGDGQTVPRALDGGPDRLARIGAPVPRRGSVPGDDAAVAAATYLPETLGAFASIGGRADRARGSAARAQSLAGGRGDASGRRDSAPCPSALALIRRDSHRATVFTLVPRH